MAAFIDARCQKCGRKYGWLGSADSPPQPCPYCHAPPSQGLIDDMKQIASMMQLLEKNADGMTPAELQTSRIKAGLSLKQAAKLLKITPEQLRAVEEGERKLDRSLAVAIDNCYQLGVKPEDPTEGQER